MTEASTLPRSAADGKYWLQVKYYPLGKDGQLLLEAHDITINVSSISSIRKTDNDVAEGNQCHISTLAGIDYTVPESYEGVLAKL